MGVSPRQARLEVVPLALRLDSIRYPNACMVARLQDPERAIPLDERSS